MTTTEQRSEEMTDVAEKIRAGAELEARMAKEGWVNCCRQAWDLRREILSLERELEEARSEVARASADLRDAMAANAESRREWAVEQAVKLVIGCGSSSLLHVATLDVKEVAENLLAWVEKGDAP